MPEVTEFKMDSIEKKIFKNRLDLYNLKIKDKDLKQICLYLNEHPNITILDLRGNLYHIDGVNELVKNKTLNKLSVSRLNSIEIEALLKNTTLTTLQINTSEIDPKVAEGFVENKTLKNLTINSCSINDDFVKIFIENKTVEFMDFSSNSLGNSTAIAFLDDLFYYPRKLKLNLEKNFIDPTLLKKLSGRIKNAQIADEIQSHGFFSKNKNHFSKAKLELFDINLYYQ